MIYGLVADWPKNKRNFPGVFDRAFAFLAGNDVAALADGKHMIDGERLFASFESLRTQDEKERRFEAHRRYLDIQILLSGVEKQLYAPGLSGMNVLEDNLEKGDIAFYSSPARHGALVLEPGQYAVYFPGEPHCPCCAANAGGDAIRKVVFKILWTE